MANSKSLKIGVDLDHTVYGFPEFFVPFIAAMVKAGHSFYCVSNHPRNHWEEKDVERLRILGIDPSVIDPSLMQTGPKDRGAFNKAKMADACDIVFDDAADKFQHLTHTPVFRCPFTLAMENRCVI